MKSSFSGIVSKTWKLLAPGASKQPSRVQKFIREHSQPNSTKLTLTWADSRQRQRVIDLTGQMGRQTMHLRSMQKSKLVVLCGPDGQLAGWAGMDAETNPQLPLLFSHFVDPAYRGLKLGALLEHVWWAYLSAWGCKKGYLRLELGNNKRLLRHRLATEYYREVTEEELVTRYVDACHYYDLYFCDNKSHVYFLIDVEEALAASIRHRGELDICSLPFSFRI